MGSPPPTSPPHLRVHSFNVYVRDQDASLRFYVEQLGFRLAFDAWLQSGSRWIAVAPPDGSALLSLVQPKPGTASYELIGRPTGVSFVTDNVLAKYAEWRQRGVKFVRTPRLRRVTFHRDGIPDEAEPRIWGEVFTTFVDLDGNRFTLVGFDEVNRQIEAERRAIAERLEAERRATQELEIAKQVQARLFPQNLPPAETLGYAGTCIQARQVGGDYFDFLCFGENRLGLVVGDICGKGMAAALLMANLQANLRSQCAIALDHPQQVLRSVNRQFLENTPESAYATLFFAEYDDGSRRLRYMNCGHLPALVVHPEGTVERLGSTATVVGLFDTWDCELETCQLQPGDTLALYTDGVTESFNEVEEDFGECRLIDAIRRRRDSTPGDLLNAIIEEVQQFSSGEQHDDITLIIAKCR